VNAPARFRVLRGRTVLVLAGTTVALALAVGGWLIFRGGGGGLGASTAGPAPPGTPDVVATNLAQWPAPNHDYANTRASAETRIGAVNVATLKPAWRYPLSGGGDYGSFSSNPLVTADRVYLQTTSSTVVALNRGTGKAIWSYPQSDPYVGPNGPALADGLVVAASSTKVFALDAESGKPRWERQIVRPGLEGIDMAPLVWNGMVIVSSAPAWYAHGGKGIVYALDLKTGGERWQFDTTTDDLWGHPELNSGGGLWYTPSVDDQGRLYMGVGNPAPFPGTKEFPNGSSRPGDNLYTDSLVVLDGNSGKLLWYFQALAHDIHDYDLQLPPILASFAIGGVPHEVVVVGGKMGEVFVLDRTSGKLLWRREVGVHNRWSRATSFPERFPIKVIPGGLGGLIAPMAVSQGIIYAAVVDLCVTIWGQLEFPSGMQICDLDSGRGELVALEGASGRILWQRMLPQASYSGTVVARDIVLTATFDGTLYAFAKRDGRPVWELKLPAGVNGTLAVTENELIVGAGVTLRASDKPAVVAYRLPG
jgi:alcohol dehydrogenase (cytochrome c)